MPSNAPTSSQSSMFLKTTFMDYRKFLPQFKRRLESWGYRLYTLTTKGLLGTLDRQALVTHMMGKGFGSQEVFHVSEEGKGYILDNTGSSGDHVCIWTMQTKSYNKLVSQFETRRGLGSFSGHMADNANCPQQASSYDIRVPQGVRTRLYQNRVFYVCVWRREAINRNA